MPSPFFNPAAFTPFYDQLVVVNGAAQRGTFKACVFEEGFDDPLSEVSVETDTRSAVIVIPKTGDGGWNCQERPRVGDKVTILSWGDIEGVNDFAVKRVDDFGDSWQIHARGAK